MFVHERPGLTLKKSSFAWSFILLAGALSFTVHVQAQTPAGPPPPPENVAAARELVQVVKATDQFKAFVPSLIQKLKAVVQGDPDTEKEKDFDAAMPIVMKRAMSRFDQLAERLAEIYARNFSVDDIHDLVAFYRSPIGQKFIERQSTITSESMALGREFGREIATDPPGANGQRNEEAQERQLMAGGTGFMQRQHLPRAGAPARPLSLPAISWRFLITLAGYRLGVYRKGT